MTPQGLFSCGWVRGSGSSIECKPGCAVTSRAGGMTEAALKLSAALWLASASAMHMSKAISLTGAEKPKGFQKKLNL